MVMHSSEKLEELVEAFASAVSGQNQAIERRDVVTGNMWALKCGAAAKELLGQGKNGLEAFAKLLGDSRRDVKTMAAAFLIPFRTIESKAILEESAEGYGVVALGAKVALQRWEEEGKGIDLT